MNSPSRSSRLWSRLSTPLLVSALTLPADILVSYVRARIPGSIPGEFRQFGPAGAEILRGNWGDVYASSSNQAGPFELVPYGLAQVLDVRGVVGWTIFYVVLVFIGSILLTTVVRQQLAAPRGRWIFYGTLAVSYLAVLGSILPNAVFLGHPAEVVIPLLWIAAGVAATRGRFVACGVIIAVAAGFEIWGVLGAPVILLASSPRLVRAAAAGLVGVALLYLPFVATGAFAMFSFHWTVTAQTLYGVLWTQLHAFPWSLRLVQAVAALAAGAGMAVLFRNSGFGVVAVPLAIVSLRLVLDPLLLPYYWLAPAVIGLAMLAVAYFTRTWVLAAFACAVLLVAWFAPSFPLIAAVLLVALGVVLAVVRWILLRRDHGVPDRRFVAGPTVG